MVRLSGMKQGDQLPNGAILLETRAREYEGESVVLALWPGNSCPYVTWCVYDDAADTTSHGDYCETLAEGLASLDRRAGKAARNPWTPAAPGALCSRCQEEPACEGLSGRCPRCEGLSRQCC